MNAIANTPSAPCAIICLGSSEVDKLFCPGRSFTCVGALLNNEKNKVEQKNTTLTNAKTQLLQDLKTADQECDELTNKLKQKTDDYNTLDTVKKELDETNETQRVRIEDLERQLRELGDELNG